MGYNLNSTDSDLDNKQGRIILPSFSSIIGHNNTGSSPTTVDLELGRSIKECREGSVMDPFPATGAAGSLKRARTPSGGGAHVVSCLVDGCSSDLSKCRDYHRRHKVCEMHSKTPRVTIAGREQRFCQQCSRFHSLGEFDEGKRSCRKRLEGHNRRRRKPQPPETLPANHANFASAAHQGNRYYGLSNQPVIPTPSSVVSSNPGGFYSSGSSNSTSCYLDSYRSIRQFNFAGSSSSSSQIFHQNGIRLANQQVMGSVSERALSLLSSSSHNIPEMGLARSIPDPTPIDPTDMGPYVGPQTTQGLEGRSPGSWGSISNFTGEAPHGSSSSVSGGGHHTISFSWE